MLTLGKAAKRWHIKNGLKCFYCGVSVSINGKSENKRAIRATVDYILPVSRGGGNNQENKVTACNRCKFDKANMNLEEYRRYLQEHRQVAVIVFAGETIN